jgi:hypothetical protein
VCICAATQPRWIGHSESRSNMRQHLYLSQLGPPKASVGFKASHAFICMRDYDFAPAGHAVVAGDLPRVDSPAPKIPVPRSTSGYPSIYAAHCSHRPRNPIIVQQPRVSFLQQLAYLRRPISDETCLSACRLHTSLPLSCSHKRPPFANASRPAS